MKHEDGFILPFIQLLYFFSCIVLQGCSACLLIPRCVNYLLVSQFFLFSAAHLSSSDVPAHSSLLPQTICHFILLLNAVIFFVFILFFYITTANYSGRKVILFHNNSFSPDAFLNNQICGCFPDRTCNKLLFLLLFAYPPC